jgi:hypothetical protein
MNIDLEKLNRLALANERKLQNARNTDLAITQGCNNMRRSLMKIAQEAGFIRCFDGSFRRPIAKV